MRNKHSLLIRALTLVLCVVLILPGLAFADDAEEDDGFDVSGSKEASPIELEGDERTTTVKLSLPAGEYQNKIDIVFAMDSSSSAQNSEVFKESVNELFNSIIDNNPNIELKVGVIRFRGRAHDAVAYLSDNAYKELVLYDDESKSFIEGALNMTEADIKAAFGNGSNTHGGIDIANEWLKADEDVPDDHKYVVLLTDGKTYIWNNDDHEPTTIYAQWYRSNSWAMQNSGKPAVAQNFSYNKYAYSVDVLDPSGLSNIFVFKGDENNTPYEQLYNSTSEELTGVSPWDEPCKYADNKTAVPDGTVTKHTVTNGADLFGSNTATYGKRGDYQYYFEYEPNDAWKGVTYLEANPFEVIDNGDGTYTFDTEKINPNYYQYHVDNLQKGMYKAGHLWAEMGEKYNCGVITYSGGSTDTALSTIRPSFLEWLHENTKFSAEITEDDDVEELFEGIDNSIRYMVASGVVTDKITEEFDLVIPEDGSSPFTMTLAGETLTSAPAGDNKWVFGEANDDGVYPYVVEYDPSTNSFEWTLNVPVENTRQVTLSYDLELKEEYAKTGWYDTNVEAFLDYVTTDGDDGTFNFEIPKVHYREKTEVTVTKIWDDDDNNDGKRPDSVTFNLLANGTQVATKSVTEDDDWTCTFTDLYKHDEKDVQIEYTVVEAAVDGYKADATVNEGGIWEVTNTHEPEKLDVSVTKVWDDENNKDKIRPESITVKLLKDGQDTGKTLVLDEKNGWKGTFTELAKYENQGKEISYTIEEVKVNGYTVKITGSASAGYTITNTHKPTPINPGTGDNTNILPLAALFLASLAGIICLVVRRRISKR